MARLGFCLAAALLLGLGTTKGAMAQGRDGAGAPGGVQHVELETATTATTGASVPFWLHANTDGRVDPTSSAGGLRGQVRGTLGAGKRWSIGYGLEATARVSDNQAAYLSEAYVEAQYGFLQLWGGRRPQVIGAAEGPLTSGSLSMSRNATPLPTVALATRGYTGVPLTNRWLEFKGRYTHAWMEDNRVAEGAYLHQKTFYLRVGQPAPVRVYAGLVHNAMWGGSTSRFGRLPQSLGDYWRTVVALNGSEDAPVGEAAYIQGNHLGTIDMGLSADVGAFRVNAYRQFVYEDRDNLKLKSPQDGLLGLVLADTRDGRWLDRIVYEHLYTKWQNGPVPPDGPERGGPGGQDNYYNHYLYRSGWTFYGRTVGNPLLTPSTNGGTGIANNRVVGHHLGVAGHVGPVAYRFLATYTRNYGTYSGEEAAHDAGRDYRFAPPLQQTSFLAEASAPWPTDDRFALTAAIGVDTGEMYADAVGLRLGVRYEPLRRTGSGL
jgi:hypothetical protein